MSATEIKKLLGNEKLVIGTDRVMKGLRNGKMEKVFVCSNIDVKELSRAASMSETEVETLEMTNDELGTFCKKPFAVSVIGILK